MSDRQFISGDEAVAVAAKLARPHVIAAYPITPQTIVVERLSDYVEDGSLKSEYLHVESEHSALSAVMGASAVGARTFTATSSQGLLYMCECLHYASGARFPIVMMNANRSTAVPWNIFGDQRDSLSQLESGWIQFYVEDAQEALDVTLQAYRIAEDPDVLTPVMVNLDGFVLTHTYELVEIPPQEAVDAFIPYRDFANRMDLDSPKSTCITAGPPWNTEFRCQQHLAVVAAAEKIREIDREYGRRFGRSYGGLTEGYRCEDAEAVLLTLGSVTGTARTVVDELRADGLKVGLLKLRCVRPFPQDDIVALAGKAKVLGVLEKDISFGYEGAVFSDVNSALIDLAERPRTVNFIGGLGGRNISRSDIAGIFGRLLAISAGREQVPATRVEFWQLRCDDYGV